MRISKTAFKSYSKCDNIYPLEQIYLKQMNNKVNLFDENRAEVIERILEQMFDDETGEDLIKNEEQLEIMLPFYAEVEKVALDVANKIFDANFIYYQNTKDQKCFTYNDENGYSFYTYLDGFFEKNENVIVIEVKATTSKKFKELGFKKEGKTNQLFEKTNSIYSLVHNYLDDDFKKSYLKLFDRYSDVGKYVFDIAIERYFIEKNQTLKNKNVKYYLGILNSDYVFDGKNKYEKINGEEVINFVDLTNVTKEYLKEIDKLKEKVVQSIFRNRIEKMPYNEKMCRAKKNDHCLFCEICWKKLFENGSILEYFSKSKLKNKKTVENLINLEYYCLSDVSADLLESPNHLIQRDCYVNNQVYLNKEKMIKGIKEIVYPIYHFDFESFQSPLPRFYGEKPFSQSLFQFSLHVEKSLGICDVEKDHYSFLVDDYDDHREELIKEMIKLIDLNNGGTVLVYNKSFESTRIKELIKIYPKYEEELTIILNHIFDLKDIVNTNTKLYQKLGYSESESKIINYYNNNLHGSYSIKKLLPIFSNISYKELEISNGTMAQVAYAKFKDSSIEEIEEMRKDLITYCCQDTWSMVVILNNLRRYCGKN